MPRPPAIRVDLELPVAGNPEGVVGRRGTRRPGLEARRRYVQVLHGLGSQWSPETGDPLVSPVDGLPVAGHPTSVRRRPSPHAADPDVVGTVFIPEPVAGNPNDVVPSGFQSGATSSIGSGGALGATTPGSGSGLTCSAKASCTGPRAKISVPSVGFASGLGWGRTKFQFLANAAASTAAPAPASPTTTHVPRYACRYPHRERPKPQAQRLLLVTTKRV